VFAYLDDPSRQTEWQPSLEAVTVQGGEPTRVGTRVSETRRLGGAARTVRYEITEHVPGSRFAFRGAVGPIRVSAHISVEPLGESRSRVTAAFDFDGSGMAGKLVAPVVRREAVHQIAQDQRCLKARLEGGV